MKQIATTIIITTLLLTAVTFYSCGDPTSSQQQQKKVTSSTCDPCLIPRSNIALLSFKDNVSYYYPSNDDSYHIGKLRPNTLTIALEKSNPDSTTLTVLTRDTLVMFTLISDKANVARIYNISSSSADNIHERRK